MFFLKTIIFTILILCSLHFEMMIMMKIGRDTTDCTEFIACGTCTDKPFCSWSLERQTCVNASSTPEKLTVYSKANCPQYSLASDRSFSNAQRYYRYKTKVSNDVNGFMDFLSGTKIQCDVSTYHRSARNRTIEGRVDGSFIVCDLFDLISLRYDFLFHCFIKFNSTILRLDHVADHYIFIKSTARTGTSHDNDACAGPEWDRDCVTCVWNDRVNTNIFKRCLQSNPCIGKETFYNRRHVQDYTFSDWDRPTVFDCPAVLDVSAVEPTSARWYGTASVTITVKNHRVLYADGDWNNITVTVAGRACHGARTVHGDRVTCTVDVAKTDALRPGPVDVTYQFEKGAGFYRLTSRQSFGWRYPEVVGFGPACGPTDGGTMLTIDGSLLSSGDVALVTAGENRTCEIVSRADDRIVCRTGRVDAPAAYGVTVTFDGWLTRRVPGAAFEYVADGPAIDAGQRLGGIVSGGTSLPVRGTRLRCAENPRAYIEHSGFRSEVGCRVENDSYMVCRSPRLDARLHGAVESVTASRFGVLADFAGRTVELSAGPDPPGYTLYPDPRFTGFEVVDGTVVLYGNELGAGYGTEDVVVRFWNAVGVCNVTRTTRDRIECVPTTWAAGPNDLRRIVVAVGDNYLITLKSRNSNAVGDIANKSSTRDTPSHDELMIFSCTIIITVGVILIAYFSFLRLKRNRQFRVNPEPLVNLKYEKGSVNLIDIET